MQPHHRRLIEEQAEAWVQDAHLHGTMRATHVGTSGDGLCVTLAEWSSEGSPVARRKTEVDFSANEMPLTRDMIRARFANPFGGK
jgi:hypothetical protein